MSGRPRLLVVSPRFLFPLDEGGRIRTANILKRMRGGAFAVTLASPAPRDAARFADQTASVCDRFVGWPERPPSLPSRVAALAGPLPVAVAADRAAAGRAAVRRELARSPNVVLADFPHSAVLLPGTPLPPSVMFTHNVEAEIFERHARVASGLRRLVWEREARRMRRFEGAALRRFDRVVAVSARDAAALRERYGLRAVERIDTGVDLDFHAFSPPDAAPGFGPDGGTVVFTGAMDWRANVDGLGFLMQEVWPRVVAARPRARALLVGRNPAAALVERARALRFDWTFTGYVDDVRPHVARAHVYVVPLRVGSGTRIKVFEAMAMGRPVVSTGLGVEGLDVTSGEHFLAADDAPAFAAAVLRLLDDAALRLRLAGAARARVEERFSWAHVARRFEEICLGAGSGAERAAGVAR